MTSNRTTELLLREFVSIACECEVRDYLIAEYAERIKQAITTTLGNGKLTTDAIAELRKTVREAFNGESMSLLVEGHAIMRAIDAVEVATLGSEQELIDLAHNAWSMALCAMQGMPIPADWGNAVEHGLRKYGINVDEELKGFEVIDE